MKVQSLKVERIGLEQVRKLTELWNLDSIELETNPTDVRDYVEWSVFQVRPFFCKISSKRPGALASFKVCEATGFFVGVIEM